MRHTDGIPTRIDLALRDLEIVSLRELIAANPDFGDTGGSLAGAPPALVASVNELRQAENRAEQRAYDLLLALAALPQGEQLGRLKRFLGVHPIGLVHAKILLERSLIDIVGLTSVDTSADPTDKTLVVPRPVRDYVRETTDPETAWATDRKALELYFGEDWVSGSIRNSPTGKRARTALCDGYEIQNASTLIVRSARRSFDASDDLSIEAAIRLASAFIETLMDGDHFRAAASLCEDMVQLLEDYGGRDKELTIFNYEYGRSLRMAGRTDQAITTFNSLDDNHLTKSQRQQASLCLALSYETIGQAEEAARIATKTIAIDRRSNSALHAKVIIAEQIGDESERESELKKYLRSAETKKAHTISNNIRLELAKILSRRGEDARLMLRDVAMGDGSKDNYYTAVRAIVDLASLPGAEVTLTPDEKTRLIHAYHFLYNERLFNAFDRCQESLWRVFESSGDRANLLNLFRRSSFIWRLNGQQEKEAKYLSRLMKIVKDLIAMGITQANRDGAYFVVRIAVVTGTALTDLALQRETRTVE